MKHFLTTQGLGREELEGLLAEAEEFVDVLGRPIPKVPALRGKTVATMFFEASTRTRLSFEKAAKALSADTMSFSPGTSALSKGESLKDTVQTIRAMGADLVVVRHKATGAPWRIASWVDVPIVNGGDGAHQHPTQALLDSLTLLQRFGTLDGVRIGIVGDVRHSRVARSDVFAFSTLGAEVTLVAPPTLLPVDMDGWPVQAAHDLDDVLPGLDAVYLLRVQAERGGASVFPSLPEYVRRFGMTRERFAALKPDAVVLHPGPMNRGVEIADSVADNPRSLVLDQVANGVAVRMAVLFRLLGGEGDE
jgi:aspartate carbamoyltransferase catalytic subunit